MDWLTLREVSAPGTPATNLGRLYEKTDGKVYFKNDAGTEYDLTGTGMSSWLLAASGTGGTESITDGETVTFSAGSGISITRSTNTITITNTSSGVTGSGTTNFIPIWASGSSLGNSSFSQSGSNVSLTGNALYNVSNLSFNSSVGGNPSLAASGTDLQINTGVTWQFGSVGLLFPTVGSDSTVDGDMWYRGSASNLKFRKGGTTVNLA